jgi:hypothetical protein
MLMEDRRLARETGQVGAAVRATELLGKQLGMFIERREQGSPGAFDELSDEQLKQQLVERFCARGMTREQACALVGADSELENDAG